MTQTPKNDPMHGALMSFMLGGPVKKAPLSPEEETALSEAIDRKPATQPVILTEITPGTVGLEDPSGEKQPEANPLPPSPLTKKEEFDAAVLYNEKKDASKALEISKAGKYIALFCGAVISAIGGQEAYSVYNEPEYDAIKRIQTAAVGTVQTEVDNAAKTKEKDSKLITFLGKTLTEERRKLDVLKPSYEAYKKNSQMQLFAGLCLLGAAAGFWANQKLKEKSLRKQARNEIIARRPQGNERS